MEKTVLIYTVDLGGKILSIDGPWNQFARDNGAYGLEKEFLLGNSLFRYIAGTGVVEAYKTMHRFLNDHPGKVLDFNYRCDSSAWRRDMRMVMENAGENIRYTSSVKGTAPHDPPLVVDYLDSGEETVRMCSWCKRIKYPENTDTWNELSRLFEICPNSFTINHGICVDCREQIPYLKLDSITY